MRSVLVTGASTGIGRATALRLDAAGWRVFAGVRKQADADDLATAGSDRLLPLILDVTEADQVAAAAARIEAAGGALHGLVNNAGIAVPGPLETLPIDDFRRQVEVNLTAQVAVTKQMLPLIRRAPGRIVFLSSIGGRIAFPFFGAYHAAKFGIEAVGDTLRRELRPWDISVSIVEPGSIDTRIWERGEDEGDAIEARFSDAQRQLYGQALEDFRKVTKATAARGIPPEKVAATIEHALTSSRPRPRYLVGADARVQARLAQVIPTRLFDRIVAHMISR
ncbi:MAG TPA: SDR family oxidoreductase [Solirubrobacterales bacterium]|jgi:NAD(P)-dependent dehydrogenase (short-subunit alcohol dehydrogenase family)|nr:SDR family oxidoreductase [Solirubrobacterales bacterium]